VAAEALLAVVNRPQGTDSHIPVLTPD